MCGHSERLIEPQFQHCFAVFAKYLLQKKYKLDMLYIDHMTNVYHVTLIRRKLSVT